MALKPGEQLGPYEIVSPLGAGGMGEVYRARDTRLERSVAIKVLPEHIAKREDARARFEREARAVASLNHPHICTLHDIGPGYMVMELIEGETLADRIEKGPIPLDQSLVLAGQIADALDRAHRAGVTHRDIKPGNIMITRDGVKVLDFGLAKAVEKPGPDGATLTKALTTEGAVVGTPQYMAPEQFEGREADARSDIWAFGAVVYEMVSGQKAFQGKSYSSLVGAILAKDPPPMAVKPFTPSWLERLVRRCLEKDPEGRYFSMHDILLDLRSPMVENAVPPKPPRWPWALAAAGFVLAAALAGFTLTRAPEVADEQPMEFEIKVPGGVRNTTVSPNGKLLAWRDDKGLGLWIRAMDTSKARMVDPSNPLSFSWSPDSRYLAFSSDSGVKTLEVATSTIQEVMSRDIGNYGSSWTPDGQIVFGVSRGPLGRVPVKGGLPTTALSLDDKAGEIAQRFPAVLPDGKQVLFYSTRSDPTTSGIYLARLDGKSPAKRVFQGFSFRFVAPRTLLVNDNARLMAVPFDPASGETGEPVVVSTAEAGVFSASADGRVIAMVSGGSKPEELALYDRSGKRLEILQAAAPQITAHLEFSPDGTRLLLERNTGGNVDLWTVELGRKVVSRLTFHESPDGPGVWSADGQKVYFRAVRPEAGDGIFEIPANGTGTEKLLYKTQTHHLNPSPDGQYLMFERTAAGARLDTLDLRNGNKIGTYLNQAATSPQFSPDSRLVAYESTETGRSEVYVQTFPAGGGKWQISTSGGIEPRWRGDGKELYYDQGNGTVMAATVEMKAGSLQVTSTKELFRFQRGTSAGTAIAVTRDGKTFAIRESPMGGESSITLKLNWRPTGK